MIITIYFANPDYSAYIAGSNDGVVTVNNRLEKRAIHLFEVGGGISKPLLVNRQVSLSNGHYMFTGLDPSKQYLIMCRDLLPNGTDQRFEPAVWDYVTPATDLTIDEQQALWQSWQETNTG